MEEMLGSSCQVLGLRKFLIWPLETLLGITNLINQFAVPPTPSLTPWALVGHIIELKVTTLDGLSCQMPTPEQTHFCNISMGGTSQLNSKILPD